MPAPAPIATTRRRCSSDSFWRLENRLPNTTPNCLGAPSRPSGTPIATITIDSTAVPERPPRRHAAGLKPDRRGNVDAVAAGETGEQPLAHADRKPRADQQTDVALGARLPRRLEQTPRGWPRPRRAPERRRTRPSEGPRRDRRRSPSERRRSRNGWRQGRARSREPFAPAAGVAAPEVADCGPVSNARLYLWRRSATRAEPKRVARIVGSAKVICANLRPLRPSFKRDLMNRVELGTGGAS